MTASAAHPDASQAMGVDAKAYDNAAGWHPGHNPWLIALTVTMATFMEVLDTSIANVALPHIAGTLSVSEDESTWVLTSYLVSNAIVLPISGWVSNRVGRKKFYMTCVALFTVSSFLCGIAPSLGMLIFFRILQGVGGGGLGPSEQSILADTFPLSKRGMAFAVYGMAVVFAPAIGPTLGGFITDNYSWRWVFFINVPVGLLSLFSVEPDGRRPTLVGEEETRAERRRRPGAQRQNRRGGAGSHRHRPREPGGRSRQRARRRLVPLCLHRRLCPSPRSSRWSVSCNLGTSPSGTHIVDLRLFKRRTFAMASLMMMALGVWYLASAPRCCFRSSPKSFSTIRRSRQVKPSLQVASSSWP